jgi:hypothetical protein
MTITDCSFTGNAANQGGTVYMESGSSLTMSGVTVTGSNSYAEGGFIYAYEPTGLIIISISIGGTSILSGLTSTTSNGGGIYLSGAMADLTIT